MIARSSKWQLQEAKNKLSEVVRRAREEGPQTITVRGEDAVVVVSASEFERSQASRPPQGESLAAFFKKWSERIGALELDLSSPPEPPIRELDLDD